MSRDLKASLQLESDLDAVAKARDFVRTRLEAWGCQRPAVDDAVLITSELVTNAVLHARTELVVEVSLFAADELRVEVFDDNSRLPVIAASPEDATSGRGLSLVAKLSRQWGAERVAGGKVVWAQVRRAVAALPGVGPNGVMH